MKQQYKYDKYYLYSEIEEIIKGYAAEHPELVRLTSLTKTPQGRDLWLVEITDTSTGDFSEKPGYFVNANIHAGEVTGSMCAMFLLDTIMSNLDDPYIRKILSRMTFYVVPRISPDGSDHYLTTPDMLRSAPRMYPYSELQPGVQPEDLDGDGVIRLMRVKDPLGAWKKSPLDSRMMTRRDPIEEDGEYYNVFSEGTVKDYDGIIPGNAPNKFGNDFNRNFPINWAPIHKQGGAGDYALSNPETAAMAKLLTEHLNICCSINLHTFAGAFLYPPAAGGDNAAFPDDIARYLEIGKIAEKETTYPPLNIRKEFIGGEAGIFGLFDEFLHFGRGIMTYTIETWDISRRAGIADNYPPKVKTQAENEADTLKIIKWADKNVHPLAFKPWTKFDHPQLGEVEIGGFDFKNMCQNCPPHLLFQEAQKVTNFILKAASILPRLNVSASAENTSENIWKLNVKVGNAGYLPTYGMKEATKLGIIEDLKVTVEGAEMVSGREVTKIGQLEGLSGVRTTMSTGRFDTSYIAPREKLLTYIIKAPKGSCIDITVKGPRAGTCKTSVSL